MRSEVIVRFGPDQELSLPLGGLPPMTPEAGRRWLDEQFVLHECAPLKATGKVLIADKLLAIPAAVGARQFEDADWSREFARAASAALGKSLVRVDVESLTVGY